MARIEFDYSFRSLRDIVRQHPPGAQPDIVDAEFEVIQEPRRIGHAVDQPETGQDHGRRRP